MLIKTVCNRFLRSQTSNSHTSCVLRFLSTSKRADNPYKNTVKLSLVGASVGAFVGIGYFLHNSNKTNIHISQSEEIITIIKDVPKIKPSRVIFNPEDNTGLKLTLYQYQTCPFCCKVRAFLDYRGISYNVVEVNPVLRDTIKWSKYKKVPILLAEVNDGYQQLNDSSMIISALASLLYNTSRELQSIVKFFPVINYKENGTVKSEIMNKYYLMMEESAGKLRSIERITNEQKWRKWADNVLVHTLSPNVYQTPGEALQAFKWFSEVGQWDIHFAAWERWFVIYVGAFAMWIIGKRLKKKYNLKDDVRESLYEECEVWMDAIQKKGTPFMGGYKPDLSDLAVYGILSSIEGCYAFKDLLKHSSISSWYTSMKQLVTTHAGMTHV